MILLTNQVEEKNKVGYRKCSCSDIKISGCEDPCNVEDINWFVAFDYILNCESVVGNGDFNRK